MSNGNRQKSYTKTTTQDNDHNGVPDYTTVENFIYDKKGQLVENGTSYDWSGDGIMDYSGLIQYAYDKKGRTVQIVQSADDDGDGVTNWINTTKYTYEKDNLVKVVAESDYGADGVIETLATTDNICKKGLITQSLTKYDWGGDGSVEQANLVTYEYDGKRLVKESYDAFNDGSVEMTVTYTPVGKDKKSYDKVTATDYDANGVDDYVTRETFIYDKKGQLTSLTNLADYDANGSIDYGNSTEYTYDKQGRVIQEVQTADEYWDGNPDYVLTINTTYDKGNVVKTEAIVYYDGGNDYQYATDYIYNKGLLQKAVTNWDWNADSAPDRTDTVSYIYDGEDLVRQEYDYGTDGSIEMLVTYEPFIA